MSKKELQIIYTGSLVDAQFVEQFLKDQGIPAKLKDPFQESLVAGWVTPGSQNGAQVLVDAENVLAAKYLIDKFLNDSAE